MRERFLGMNSDEAPTGHEAPSPGHVVRDSTREPSPDTALFINRARQEIHEPLTQVLEACDRLIGQARRMGREYLLLPNLQIIEKAARDLVEQLSDSRKLEAGKQDLELAIAALDLAGKAAESGTDRAASKGSILLVDDNERTCTYLTLQLERQGYSVTIARSGEAATELLGQKEIDLVLLDIDLPGIDGFTVLERVKADPKLVDIPVIMESGEVRMDNLIRCIESGAEDFLPKPLNSTVLSARIDAGLRKKRQRQQEIALLKRLETEQEKSERLLLNILPKGIADRLKQGETSIADSFSDVTVMFADVVGFTEYSTRVSPAELVNLLNELFSGFDRLADWHGLEKIKTIGDEYMVVGGLSMVRHDHAEAVVDMALGILDQIANFNQTHGAGINIRIGIHTGPVVAGIIGIKKFAYDLWGETVNIASRMQTHGVNGKIQMSEATRGCLPDKYRLDPVRIHVKGKGEMQNYLLSRNPA